MPVYGPVRFSFLTVFEPRPTPDGKQMKYSVCNMIPATDKKLLATINKDIQDAIAVAIDSGKFPKAKVPLLRLPVRDGSAEAATGQRGAEFDGFMFFNASSKNKPGAIDSEHNQVMDPEAFFSGWWGYIDVNFFGYNTSGNVGIGCGLNNIMFTTEDDRLDGRKSAETAFADVNLPPAEDADMA